MSKSQPSILRLISKSWIFFFALLCGIGYEQSSASQRKQYLALLEHYQSLEEKKKLASGCQKLLKEKIASQDDPRWVELTLKKELGVVAEGEKKVFFYPKADQNINNYGTWN